MQFKDNTFTEHRKQPQHQVTALILVLAAAAVVGYVAWQSMSLPAGESEVVIEAAVEPMSAGSLFFAATLRDATSTVATTYQYDLDVSEWRPVFEYPFHYAFSSVGAGQALVTVPVVDQADAAETDVFAPAFVELDLDLLTYLDTPSGYNEQHYRLAPTTDAPIAYMYTPTNVGPTSGQMDITNWDVVIHQSTTKENKIIKEAMYPQWLSATELLVLRPSGVSVYDVTTDIETSLNLPFVDFTAANQFAYSGASTTNPLLVMSATGQNEFSVIGNYTLDEGVTVEAGVFYAIGQDNTVFTSPTVSPDQSKFAILVTTRNTEAEVTSSEIRIYDFENTESLEVIDLSLYDPITITLLGWK